MRKYFVAGGTTCEGFPLGGTLSPKVTDEGGDRVAQRTHPAGHASQSFPARRRGKKIQSCFDRLRRPKHTSRPESASFAGAGRGASPNFGSPAQRVPKFLPFPARPAGGRAVTGVGQMGRRPGRIKKTTSRLAKTRERWVQGGENLSPPWCSFLRLSSKESRAPPLESAGETTLQGPPCAGPEGPSNGPPPRAGRATGRCAPR